MARQGRAKRHVESNMCHAAGTWHLSAHAAMSEALDALLDLRRGRPDTPMLPGLAAPRGPLANFSIRMIRPWLSGACLRATPWQPRLLAADRRRMPRLSERMQLRGSVGA